MSTLSRLIYGKSADIELARLDDEFYINKRSGKQRNNVVPKTAGFEFNPLYYMEYVKQVV